jgi:hypothetical protein
MRRYLLVISLMATLALGLYEREKGLNDWHLEHLGELKDLKFIEKTSLVYTLSTNGVLTLFDTDKQAIQWKKELPNADREDYNLRYLSRNLLVYSENRAILLNSVSHVIYDVHLEGFLDKATTAKGFAVEFFELKGHVYSVFAKNNKVIIYKDYQQVGVLEYSSKNMRPLSLIFDRATQQLVLLTEIDGKQFQSFFIDAIKQEMVEGQTSTVPNGLNGVTKTKRYFSLHLQNSISYLLATDISN